MKKIVAVVGAGSSGLAAIKSCKEEEMDVICFEKSDRIGGLWNYKEGSDFPSVMKSTVINTHKEMTAFSDFPPPSHFQNYMHNSQIKQYLYMYAENFDLLSHIRYKHEVVNVSKADNYNETGRWKVTFKILEKQEILEEIFDGVMLCSGHHVFSRMPQIEGLNLFRGQILHSQSLKTPDAFKGLKVLVIGIGNSGVDAAVELSNVAEQVYLSTRRGAWVFTRSGLEGMPYDALLSNRLFNFCIKLFGWRIGSWILEEYVLNKSFNHEFYGLKPKHRALSQHPTINDCLASKILSGRIILKGNVKFFSTNSVIFDGGNSNISIDAVIFATGYQITFPFIHESILNTTDNEVELYKLSFSPELKYPSLIVIGLSQPLGSIFPIAEAQSRWFALLMKEKVKLPDYERMKDEIYRRKKALKERYVNSPRHTIQVDYINFMDDITSEYNATPNMTKMLFSDPILFLACLLGPSLPYQYRLQGPHCWRKARETILKFPSRVVLPLTNKLSRPHYSRFESLRILKFFPIWLTLPVILLIIYLWIVLITSCFF
ncbi:UNVERIFIED_CONTAM: Dimethylaniline monooxygenase [N-oxide-forming] 5 [Trichonephila clavipes]